MARVSEACVSASSDISTPGMLRAIPNRSRGWIIAVKLLAEAGAEIREITLPALQDFSACGQIILAAEAYAVHEQWLKERPALVQQLVDHELTETALQHLVLEPGQRADHVVGKLASENRAQGDGFSGGTRTVY